jgi:ELWxxDGT repeat protein
VKDIYPGSNPVVGANSSYPAYLTVVGGRLYFQAQDATHGAELWKSDGTAAGTTLVKDINPTGSSRTSAGGFQMDMAVLNGILYFGADDGVNGAELWRSDGSDAGTVMVKDIHPGTNPVIGANSSYPAYLSVANGSLFFQAQDATHGAELWKSDGTAAGTVLVKDINPTGSSRSYSAGFYLNIMPFHNVLYFAADDGVNGSELWRSDGTAAGTYMVGDIYPGTNPVVGANSSYPAYLAVSSGTLYFQAQDATHGTEMWAYRLLSNYLPKVVR